MTTTNLEYVGELVVVRCWCGIQHAVPKSLRDLQDRQFNDGKDPRSIYCPLGHQHVPGGETESERLRRTLVQERARHDQTRAELRETELQRRAEKGAKTRLAKRIAAGVCPCCKRHFANVQRHMATKHPSFIKK